MTLLLNSAITAAFFLLAGLWLKNFLPNYFNEKGKLLAQKEDIEEITHKIESVKFNLSKDTERLKADLQRLLNFQISHRNEERNSIIGFYDKYNQWLYALLEINFGAYNTSNVNELSDKRIYIEKFYSETSIAQAKLALLVQDDEIIALSHKLLLALLNFKNWMDIRLLALQQNLEKSNSINRRFIEVAKEHDENRPLMMAIAADDTKLREALQTLVKSFYDNRTEEFKKIPQISSTFTLLVKQYLIQ